MKVMAFASAVLIAATLLSPALAAGLVPGSDHYEMASADAATHSVATGVTAPVVNSSISETRSFGYPETVSATGGVPGSRTETRARDGAALNAVARGEFGLSGTPATGLFSSIVPGSDSY